MKQNIAIALAVIALGLSGWQFVSAPRSASFGAATTAGNLLAENYLPFVMYNGGYNSAKDISTTANINGAVGTFTAGIVNSMAGTSTMQFLSTTANKGICWQINGTSSATNLKLEATTTGALNVVFGTCP